MPATFSHPLAVVPLFRFCPRHLNFAALVIGSMSPDFGYFARQFQLASFAHTALGTLVLCVSSGLIALGLFYLLRGPVCFLLPQPHRHAFKPLFSSRPRPSLRGLVVAVVSLLIGAWSHTIWDSFTHGSAWTVQHFALLRRPVFSFGDTVLPASHVLQQLSTVVGAMGLAVLYFRWRRRRPSPPPGEGADLFDGWRYAVILSIAALALVIAAPAAHAFASDFNGLTALRALIFRTTVYFGGIFLPLLIVASVALHAVRKRKA